MKRYFILILAVAVGVASCSKEDILVEEPFIENSDGTASEPDTNPYWDWCEAYPGPVSNLIATVDTTLVIPGGVPQTVDYAPGVPVLHSTNLYCRMDEVVTVIVPDDATNLHYQIGIGYKLLEDQVRMRMDDVVVRGKLQAGENQITSPYGGFLYFYFQEDLPVEPDPEAPVDPVLTSRASTRTYPDATVEVHGAIPGNAYRMGVDNGAQWSLQMRDWANLRLGGYTDSDSLAFLDWAEMRSDKVILNVGVKELSELYNPDLLLEAYGRIADAYLEFGGYSTENYAPFRLFTDIELPDPTHTTKSEVGHHVNSTLGYYGGYPIGYRRDQNATAGSEKRLVELSTITFGNEGATNVNGYWIFTGFAQTVMGDWAKAPFFRETAYKMGYYYYAFKNGLNPNRTINFQENANKLVRRLAANRDSLVRSDGGKMDMWWRFIDEWPRTTMFMQLAYRYGWNIFPYINQRSRELGFKYNPEGTDRFYLWSLDDQKKYPELISDYQYTQSAIDFFVMSACEYTDTNLLPFFRAWNIPVSPQAAQYAKNFKDLGPFEKDGVVYTGAKQDPTKSDAAEVTGQPVQLWEYRCYVDDPANRPSFDLKLTPNKSFEAQRPRMDMKYTWYVGETNPELDSITVYNRLMKRDTSVVMLAAYVDSDISSAADFPAWEGSDPNNEMKNNRWACIAPAVVTRKANVSNPNNQFYKNFNWYAPYKKELSAWASKADARTVNLTRNELTFTLVYDEPHRINCLRWIHGLVPNSVDEIWGIEYWEGDDETGEWKPVSPNQTRLRDAIAGWQDIVHFEQTYETTRIRFKARPRYEDVQTTVNVFKIRDISFGLLE